MNTKKPSIKTTESASLQDKNHVLKVSGADDTMAKEINGYADQGLLEPTRYNDWEVKGRCSDF